MASLIEQSGVRFAARSSFLLLGVVLFGAACSSDTDASSTSLIGDDPVVSIMVSGEWTRVDLTVDLLGVVEGGPGFVAVGVAPPCGVSTVCEPPEGMVVLTSPDGSEWSVAAEYPKVFSGVSPAGLFATNVGLMIIGLADEGPLVMISDDGVSWTHVPDDDSLSGVGLNSVTTGGPGVVAMGIYHIDPDWHAAILTSPNGQTWTRVSHDDALFVDDAALLSVAEGSDLLVAVGRSGHSPLATLIMTSEDGLLWERVPHQDDVFGDSDMRTVARLDEGFLAGGTDNADTGGEDDDGLNAVILVSPDGLTWTRVAHDEALFGDSIVDSVTETADRAVAVGSTTSFDRAVVWTSADGHLWDRLAHDPELFGRRHERCHSHRPRPAHYRGKHRRRPWCDLDLAAHRLTLSTQR